MPAGLPSLHFVRFDAGLLSELLANAVGIALVSFTSGVLTAKSFARLNRYEINANQELVAFGACNSASGLAQGFPVTGADSRTAVNNAMDGKTQLVGVVALARFFNHDWATNRRALFRQHDFPTLKSAVRAFNRHKKKQVEPEHHAPQA